MNRRRFISSLSALGAAPFLPVPVPPPVRAAVKITNFAERSPYPLELLAYAEQDARSTMRLYEEFEKSLEGLKRAGIRADSQYAERLRT